MIWLVFMACFGGTCQLVELPWHDTMARCNSIYGQMEIALWINRHDGYERRGRHWCQAGVPT